MIRMDVGIIGGQKVQFCQALTIEEARECGLPEGVYHYWETEKGEKIFSPFKIISEIQKEISASKFDENNIEAKKNIESFHKRVYDAQRDFVVTTLERTRSQYIKMNAPRALIEQVERQIKEYSNQTVGNPDMDGMYRPGKEEREAIMQSEKEHLLKYYSEEKIREIFGL